MGTLKLISFYFLITITTFASGKVKLGVDNFIKSDYKSFIGKNLGLITNASGVTSDLESTIDALNKIEEIKLVKLFGPEHGIRGDVYGGDKVKDATDPKTNLPVYSLYGKHRKPTKEMLEGIDVLIYDIQDITNRTYTYIYTMAYAMEAAAEYGIEFVVLDRPTAVFGETVDGNILDPEFSSFIGLYPIPYIYGMTPGELATLFNSEFNINANLKIIKMNGYNHQMDFHDTGLTWVPTSPHIPRAESAYFCGATGAIGELWTVCVGIGYTLPFELVGADWMDSEEISNELNKRNLPGVKFRPITFKPFYSQFEGEKCYGTQIMITDKTKFKPFTTTIHIATAIQKHYPDEDFLSGDRIGSFDKAAGTDQIRKDIKNGKSADEIISGFEAELNKFKKVRKQYLLYD